MYPGITHSPPVAAAHPVVEPGKLTRVMRIMRHQLGPTNNGLLNKRSGQYLRQATELASSVAAEPIARPGSFDRHLRSPESPLEIRN